MGRGWVGRVSPALEDEDRDSEDKEGDSERYRHQHHPACLGFRVCLGERYRHQHCPACHESACALGAGEGGGGGVRHGCSCREGEASVFLQRRLPGLG